jgi:hypothetical protein
MESSCARESAPAHCDTRQRQRHLLFILQQRDAVNKRVGAGDCGYGQRHAGVLHDEGGAEADHGGEHGDEQQRQHTVELREVVAYLHVPEKVNFVGCKPEEEARAQDCSGA